MSEEKNLNSQQEGTSNEQQYSLNDDRRVKVLSPGAMVAKRFFRNGVAVFGMIVLVFMFAFSFIGGVLSPYEEDEKFYTPSLETRDAYRKAYELYKMLYGANKAVFDQGAN